MFIVITGLDGSGTSTIGQTLHELDKGSYLFKTPSKEYKDRDSIDTYVKMHSKVGHLLYYLSSTVFMSDYIKNNCDYINKNVYLVRYLIDTVVSNRVAGIPIDLNYNIYGNQLLIPDLTLFITLNEDKRTERINARGKSNLDKVLDDDITRLKFLNEFNKLLDPQKTIYIDNSKDNYYETTKKVYTKIKNK